MVPKSEINGVERRTLLKAVGGGAIATTALGMAGSTFADEHEETYSNPTGPRGFGDPSVIRADDGTFYVYGTSTPEDVIPIAKSDDLVNWEHIGAALDREPVWRSNPDAGVWAPDINYFDGQYHLYYSYSTWGSENNPGIGVATADTPEGPFTDRGPVFREEDLDMTNCIDSDLVFVDGTPYMVWGSWYGIYGVELTEDGMDYVPGTEFHMAGNLKEGAMIVEENDYYYLFYSTGHCCDGYESTYEVEVGRSSSFFGPYYNQNGDDLRDLDEHHSGVSVMSGTDQFIGTGHNTAIQDDAGDWWMLYHAEATAEQAGRILMVDRIRWDENDWPVVGDDGTPSTESTVPHIDYEGGQGSDDEQGSEDDEQGSDDDEQGSDDDGDDQDADDGSADDGNEDDGVPGFGIVEPILAAGGAGYLLKRRSDEEREE